MILLPDLISFSENFVLERPNLEGNITVASHDEAASEYKEVVNANNSCTLITLIPTHDDTGTDEDNASFNNNLTFLVLKKTDTKALSQVKLNNFSICQLEVLALAKKLKTLISSFEDNCMFKNFQVGSIQILPLQNYMNANGYSISLINNTPY